MFLITLTRKQFFNQSTTHILNKISRLLYYSDKFFTVLSSDVIPYVPVEKIDDKIGLFWIKYNQIINKFRPQKAIFDSFKIALIYGGNILADIIIRIINESKFMNEMECELIYDLFIFCLFSNEVKTELGMSVMNCIEQKFGDIDVKEIKEIPPTILKISDVKIDF